MLQINVFHYLSKKKKKKKKNIVWKPKGKKYRDGKGKRTLKKGLKVFKKKKKKKTDPP